MGNVLNYGGAIRAIRTEKGISEKELADRINMPPTTYSGYENNQRIMKDSRLEQIADALEVTSVDIIRRAVEMYDNKPMSFDSSADFTDAWNKSAILHSGDPETKIVYVAPQSGMVRTLAAFDHLNAAGKDVIADIAESLVTMEKYRSKDDMT